jgi:hypothetical protein
MAIVRELKPRVLEKDSRHTETEATYSIVEQVNGVRLLQIDTYGSDQRRIPGKVSQSIRFSPEAIDQLKKIIREQLDR